MESREIGENREKEHWNVGATERTQRIISTCKSGRKAGMIAGDEESGAWISWSLVLSKQGQTRKWRDWGVYIVERVSGAGNQAIRGLGRWLRKVSWIRIGCGKSRRQHWCDIYRGQTYTSSIPHHLCIVCLKKKIYNISIILKRIAVFIVSGRGNVID